MINKKKIKKDIDKLESMIELHESMKNSYFWSPPSSSAQRRLFENQRTAANIFYFFGSQIGVAITTRCSCKNIYYNGNFYLNDVKVNVSKVKNIINAIKTIV